MRVTRENWTDNGRGHQHIVVLVGQLARIGIYYFAVERYSSILERRGQVCNAEITMALVLRLLTHLKKVAFIDALSSCGWDVDLQALPMFIPTGVL